MSNDKKTGEVSEVKSPKTGKGKPQGQAPKKTISKLKTHANGAEFTPERPGVVAAILRICVNATTLKPISKKGLLALICKEFGDREPAKLQATCSGQLPSQLKIEKQVIMREVLEDGEGTGTFYFDGKATDELRKSKGKPPLMMSRQVAGVDVEREFKESQKGEGK